MESQWHCLDTFHGLVQAKVQQTTGKQPLLKVRDTKNKSTCTHMFITFEIGNRTLCHKFVAKSVVETYQIFLNTLCLFIFGREKA